MTELVNLTPHDIVVVVDNDDEVEMVRIPPSGTVARVRAEQKKVSEVNGIPVVRTEFNEITGLPEPRKDVIYIASTLVAQAANKQGRLDVVSPDTGPSAIRDEHGNILAVKRFQVF